MNKIWSFVCVVALNSTSLIAQPSQTGTISGFVYDVANGEALIGANVFLENTLSGSSTNLSGYYVIPRIPAGDYTLVAHYIGYKPFKQMLTLHGNAKREVHIYLQAEAIVMEKIVVTGEAIPTIEKLFARPVSKIDLSAKQINQMPQVAEADLLRSMQTLPGILPVYDWSSELYVRGGTPDQNLYLIDGTDVYNPEHGFGLFSTFNTDAIKKIELSKGGFGAQYGGRLSSILNVT
ncbi:MAG: carboxypeptidase-like regulatory domain-containing protein, partial [bacterium]